MAQMVKLLSTMWETQVLSLGWEDPLEKEMAIHSRTIAWKIPWTEEPGRLQSMESKRVGHNLVTKRIRTGYNTRIKKNEKIPEKEEDKINHPFICHTTISTVDAFISNAFYFFHA